MRADSAGELTGDCSGLPTSTTRFCSHPTTHVSVLCTIDGAHPQLRVWRGVMLAAHHRGFLRRLFGILLDDQAQAALYVRQD